MSATPDTLAHVSRGVREGFYALLEALSAVRSLAEADVHSLTERELAMFALDVLLAQQDADSAAIYLKDGDHLVRAAARRDALSVSGDTPEDRWPPRLADDTGPVSIAAAERIIRYVADCRDGTATGGWMPPDGTLLCAPFGSNGDLLGVVCMHHALPDHFEPWQEHLLSLYCSVLGHMVAGARLQHQLEDAVADRTRQLEAALRETRQLKVRYEQLSNQDDLTGLPNRRHFFPEAEAQLARAVRHQEHFCLILLDVDYFKRINDTLGHAMGDVVLRDVADALLGELRTGDLIARYGGEEFVLGLPHTDREGAARVAGRIRDAVRALHWERDGQTANVTVSIGVSCLPAPGADAPRILLEDMLREADHALYYGKHGGRDTVRFYEDIQPPDPES